MVFTNRGYSLVELLVTIFIAGLIMAAAYFTYTELFRELKGESESVEAQIEKVVGLELIRLDLEHLGFGIPPNSPYKIIEWDNINKILTIRSTLNNTDQKTFGWILCNNGDMISDFRADVNNNDIVYINIDTKEYKSVGTDVCPVDDVVIGFPIDDNANDCTVDGKNTCITVKYEPSSINILSHCNPNTFNLLRKVGEGTGIPVLNCVSDFTIRFGLDTDNDGIVDDWSESLPTDNSQIIQQLKVINFYAVIQEGGLNSDYVYPGGNTITIDNIVLNLPADYIHYRWKVIKISVKPMSMFGNTFTK
ncbi:PilW family protein [Persephonella sp.]